jgi:hypothetical protein
MSTEITKTEQPAARQMIRAGDRGMILASLDDMWRAAGAFHKSGLFIKSHDSVEKTFVAMQCGAEVGLPPVQSLQSIAVINGRPTIWGDALPGLVWGSGLCDGIEERIEGTGDNRTAICIARRKGVSPTERRFSMADAKRAGLLGKGPWTQYPDRMLQMRARGFALRDAFADVLKGLQIREEVLDYPAEATTEEAKPAGLTVKLPIALPEPERTEVEPTDVTPQRDVYTATLQEIGQVTSSQQAAQLAMKIAGYLNGGELTQDQADELTAALAKEMA